MLILKKSDETILDFLYNNYGDYSLLPQYLNATGNNYDDFTTGNSMNIPVVKLPTPEVQQYTPISKNEQSFDTYDIYEGENPLDICLNIYGDVSKLLELMDDLNINNYLDIRGNKNVLSLTQKSDYVYFLNKNKIRVNTDSDYTVKGKYGDFDYDYSYDYSITINSN